MRAWACGERNTRLKTMRGMTMPLTLRTPPRNNRGSSKRDTG